MQSSEIDFIANDAAPKVALFPKMTPGARTPLEPTNPSSPIAQLPETRPPGQI
jgi:hypothetical protein